MPWRSYHRTTTMNRCFAQLSRVFFRSSTLESFSESATPDRWGSQGCIHHRWYPVRESPPDRSDQGYEPWHHRDGEEEIIRIYGKRWANCSMWCWRNWRILPSAGPWWFLWKRCSRRWRLYSGPQKNNSRCSPPVSTADCRNICSEHSITLRTMGLKLFPTAKILSFQCSFSIFMWEVWVTNQTTIMLAAHQTTRISERTSITAERSLKWTREKPGGW